MLPEHLSLDYFFGDLVVVSVKSELNFPDRAREFQSPNRDKFQNDWQSVLTTIEEFAPNEIQLCRERSLDMGWRGFKDHQILDLAEKHPFDVFITADKNLPYQ